MVEEVTLLIYMYIYIIKIDIIFQIMVMTARERVEGAARTNNDL